MKNLFILIAVLFLFSCNNQNPEKMLGQWKSVKEGWRANIYKHGDMIIIHDDSFDPPGTDYEILSNGEDYFINTPFRAVKITYLKDKDRLKFNQSEWVRVHD